MNGDYGDYGELIVNSYQLSHGAVALLRFQPPDRCLARAGSGHASAGVAGGGTLGICMGKGSFMAFKMIQL